MKKHFLFLYIFVFSCSVLFSHGIFGANYPSEIDLSDPFNVQLFKILGDDQDDRSGFSTATGDINGDGLGTNYDLDYIQTCQYLFNNKDIDEGGTCFCEHCIAAAKKMDFDLKAAITDKTCLVSIMMANNETGTLQPIPELAAIAKEWNQVSARRRATLKRQR